MLTTTVAGAAAPAWALFTTEHTLRFLFEIVTDLAFVPSLAKVARRRRHFELFIGVLQFLSVSMYNVADALEISIFLTVRRESVAGVCCSRCTQREKGSCGDGSWGALACVRSVGSGGWRGRGMVNNAGPGEGATERGSKGAEKRGEGARERRSKRRSFFSLCLLGFGALRLARAAAWMIVGANDCCGCRLRAGALGPLMWTATAGETVNASRFNASPRLCPLAPGPCLRMGLKHSTASIAPYRWKRLVQVQAATGPPRRSPALRNGCCLFVLSSDRVLPHTACSRKRAAARALALNDASSCAVALPRRHLTPPSPPPPHPHPLRQVRQWHELANVTTITYALLLCIYLMGNRLENQDHLLRYSAFALVWIAQLRDNYWWVDGGGCGAAEQGSEWRRLCHGARPSLTSASQRIPPPRMAESQYTAYVVVPFSLLPILKIAFGRHVPVYNTAKVSRGLIALALAGALFYVSLDDAMDPHRLFHGLAQVRRPSTTATCLLPSVQAPTGQGPHRARGRPRLFPPLAARAQTPSLPSHWWPAHSVGGGGRGANVPVAVRAERLVQEKRRAAAAKQPPPVVAHPHRCTCVILVYLYLIQRGACSGRQALYKRCKMKG